jgi:hypothetical protein
MLLVIALHYCARLHFALFCSIAASEVNLKTSMRTPFCSINITLVKEH